MKLQSLLAIVTATILFSCGKDDTPAVQKTYLVKETRGTATTDYKYDNQNRYAGNVYRTPTYHEESFSTRFHSNGFPIEIILRNYTGRRATKYTYTYDASNRCTKIEIADSTNPTTYTPASRYDFTYTPTKITRTLTYLTGGATPRFEITVDANGNFTKDDYYDNSGVYTREATYASYDDKQYVYNATFPYIFNYVNPKNNVTAASYRDVVSGTTSGQTATYTYNSDGYPTQAVWTTSTGSSVTYNYTYEKR